MVAMSAERAPLVGKRILLVEDDFLVAISLVRMLNGMGCEVIGPIPSVEEGTASAERDEFEGAVLDVNIHGGHSGPIAEIVRNSGRPLLFITGYGSPSALPGDLRRLPRLSKPVSRESLQAALEEQFEQAP